MFWAHLFFEDPWGSSSCLLLTAVGLADLPVSLQLPPALVRKVLPGLGWRFRLCPLRRRNQLPRGFEAFIQKRGSEQVRGE